MLNGALLMAGRWILTTWMLQRFLVAESLLCLKLALLVGLLYMGLQTACTMLREVIEPLSSIVLSVSRIRLFHCPWLLNEWFFFNLTCNSFCIIFSWSLYSNESLLFQSFGMVSIVNIGNELRSSCLSFQGFCNDLHLQGHLNSRKIYNLGLI